MTPVEVAELCVCFWLAPQHVRDQYRHTWLVDLWAQWSAARGCADWDAAEVEAEMKAARTLFEVAP